MFRTETLRVNLAYPSNQSEAGQSQPSGDFIGIQSAARTNLGQGGASADVDFPLRVQSPIRSNLGIINFTERLTADRTYYISTTGSDSNNGLSASSPFLTPQKFADIAATLNRGIYRVIGQFADGVYNTNPLLLKTGIGALPIIFRGNISDNSAVIFRGSSGGTIRASNVRDTFDFQNIHFQNTANVPGIELSGLITFCHGGCIFAPHGTEDQVKIDTRAIVTNQDPISLNWRNMTISGGSGRHVFLYGGANYNFVLGTITLINNASFSIEFVRATFAYANFYGITVQGTATGRRYTIDQGRIGPTFNSFSLPGSIDGVLLNGGVYG